jgi:hypothetical protein
VLPLQAFQQSKLHPHIITPSAQSLRSPLKPIVMQITTVLSALALATPLLAQTPKSCLGFDGFFIAQNTAQPCNFSSFLFVDDSSVGTCQGQGTTAGPTGPWHGNCLPGISFVVNPDGFSATYTNSTGSFTKALIHTNPSFIATCATTQHASSSFVSSPNDCLNQ